MKLLNLRKKINEEPRVKTRGIFSPSIGFCFIPKLRLGVFAKKCNKKEAIILAVLLVVATFLRLYQLEKRTSFGADQEEIAFKSIELLSGDPVLLGPVTSVGKFSIGPLFTYLWTIYSLIFNKDPVAGAYLSISLGILTACAFYIAGKILFDSKTALFLASIYSLSYTTYVWDISPWAPSLFFLSEVLLLTGGYLALISPYGFLLAALGFSIGFSSHVGIFITLIPVLLFWIIKKPKLDKKLAFISCLIVFVGVLPNLAFDVTHNFDNTKRLLGITKSPVMEGAAPAYFNKIPITLFNSTSRIIVPSTSRIQEAFLFFLVTTLVLIDLVRQRKKNILSLLLLSIFIPILIFFIWRGSFSEYYLTIMVVVPFIFLVGYLFGKYYQKGKALFLGVALILLFLNLNAWKNRARPLNLAAMKKAVATIVEKGGKEGYGVSLTTKPGYQFGYKYIFYNSGATPDMPPKKGQTKIFTIVIPPGFEGVKAMIEYDGIGVLWEGVEE